VNNRRVVITGLAPVTPIGVGVEAFWDALLEGRRGVRAIQAFDPSRFESRIGGEIEGLKIGAVVPKSYRKSGKIMARDIVLAAAAAYYAVRDADLRTKCVVDRGEASECNVASDRLGANIGSGLICADLQELAEALHSASDNGEFSMAKWGEIGMKNLTPLWLLKFLPNMLACHVTILHEARGPSNTITCGEASSHLAIGEGFRQITRGSADVSMCGGAESKTNPMALMRQCLGRRLSTNNDNPEQACKPFGKDRDGTVISEGGGTVILEELEHAKARGARIYAELVGFGAAADAYDSTRPNIPHPEGRGGVLAAKKAFKDAGIRAEQLDLIAAQAGGLRDRDAIEAIMIRELLGEQTAETPVMTVKGSMGANGAGSGAIDFIASVLALYHGVVPPGVNCDSPDPAFGLKLVAGRPIDANIEYALSYAYALSGGQNAALMIKRY